MVVWWYILASKKCATISLGVKQTVCDPYTNGTAHINNLYNTVFWALVLEGKKTEREAHNILKGTVSADKHEILFKEFGINYDKLPAFFRKGTTLVWAPVRDPNRTKTRTRLFTLHVDIIGDDFWRTSRESLAPVEARCEGKCVDHFYEQAERHYGTGFGSNVLRF